MKKGFAFAVLAFLLFASLGISERRLDSTREDAKNWQGSCITSIGKLALQNKGRQNYCICMRDYLENVNAPHSIIDRFTFGFFWSKKEALKEHSSQLARCESGR